MIINMNELAEQVKVIDTYFTIDEVYGIMPNQAYGTIKGRHWYFRARHGGWTLEIINADKSYPEPPELLAHGNDEKTGWMELDECRLFIFNILCKLTHNGEESK